MAIFRRGNVWWMALSCKGEQIRRSTETTDKKLAGKIYAKVLTQIAEGKWFDRLQGEGKTFRELMQKYLDEYSSVNKAPTSYARDKTLSAQLLKSFGNLALKEISPKIISEYKNRRRKEGMKPRTINYELTLMNHAFNIAARDWEWLRDNPVSRVSREKVNNFVERWLTIEEEECLLAHSAASLREIIVFAINTGLRQSELLNLAWDQIDLFRKTLTILEQKNKSKDTIPLNERSVAVLKERMKVRSIRPNLVFYSTNGTKINDGNLRRAFYGVVKKSGIKRLRFHDLRHTFATRMVQAGVDIYTVQRLGRWKNISMVMRYAHHYPESLRQGVEALDKSYHNFSTISKKGITENS